MKTNESIPTPLTDAEHKHVFGEKLWVTDTFARMLERQPAALVSALEGLLAAVTSKHAPDTREPIAWSGSPQQNNAMYAGIEAARRALADAKGEKV